MKKRQYVILSTLLIIVSVVAWSLYTNFQANSKKNKDKRETFQYAKVLEVENAPQSIFIIGYGRVNPSMSITVSPEVAGVILKGNIKLKQGVRFSKGSILFRIDDREAQLSLKARKSSFLNLMAGALADIKIDYPTSYETWNSFFTSLDVDKDFPSLPSTSSSQEKTFLASRNVLSEYYNIKKDEIRLSKYTIRAPFSGYFASVNVQEGAFVNMGTPVAQLSQISELEVAVPVDKENIDMILVGQDVEMKTRGNKHVWYGKVRRIEQQINANTQSVNVYVSPNNGKNELYPGMYLEVSINAGDVSNSFELPRKALGNENTVQLIQDSILSTVQVNVIKKNRNSYIITGLESGDLVITEQVPNVMEGQKIVPVK